MSGKSRVQALGLIVAVAFFALLGAYAAQRQQTARAAAPAASAQRLPDATCNFTVLNFNIGGTGSIEVTRTVAITAGDTFEQFIAPPITATASSSAYAIFDTGFSGTATGGITGTFTLTNINGILVTNPEGATANPRGFMLHNIVINGASGTITAALAINFVALSASPPYYPRAFNGYLHSISTSGSYAAYRYNGTIGGTILQNFNGSLQISAGVTGRLYTGGGTLNEAIGGLRSAPPNRGLLFQPTDIIAQFRSPDFSVGSVSAGHITPRTAFVGTTGGTINGGFVLDHSTLGVDAGSHSGKGWMAGEFTFSDSGGDILTGPWLADVNVSGGTSIVGYVWQVAGTGIYTDSLLFGTVVSSLYGGTTLAGQISGVYCDGSVIPTSTPAISATPALTNTPTGTASATPSAPATFTTTTPTAVSSTPTVTSIPVATITGTPCVITFTDVHPTDYFYEAVRYLYCRGAISGYGDNTFRPYNNTTRGQLAKIVVSAEGWPINTTGGPHFNDVPVSSPFYPWIETAYNRVIISGYSCGGAGEPCPGIYFRPAANVTRAQLSKIIVSAEGWPIDTTGGPHFNDVPASDPFYGWIETAYNRRIISGYSCGGAGEPCPGIYFRPAANATRGQISKIVYNAVTAP